MILITGGCGYLGSHFIVKLVEEGQDIISIDNFSNSSPDIIEKVNQITNKNNKFIEGDLRDIDFLEKLFLENKISSVIHFAGLKSISESIQRPLEYYSSNISGSIILLNAMKKAQINKIIFSSSATVYGENHKLPWNENLDLRIPNHPYAQSKLIVEEILRNISLNESNWGIGILRYFNPIGSHKSGIIGENIHQEAANLFPAIVKVLIGQSNHLNIFGDDYDTIDGTGIRDYLHIDDLLDGHLKALYYINKFEGFNIWNLGTGKGHSVFEILKIFEKLTDKKIPYKVKARRQGDLSEYWADVSKAKRELDWNAKNDIKQMIEDTLTYIDKLKLDN
tara:strand:- start:2140 stop:3147 length:1008 start_codon:yes stop_codon:yes gene_type:complete